MQSLTLLVLVGLVGVALAARESRVYPDGMTIIVTRRAKNCTRAAQNGDTLYVHYTGTLEDGTVFDSSYNRGQPWSFRMGTNDAIQGYNVGLFGMCVGEKRQLIVPPSLGYGSRGLPGAGIPPNVDMYFDDELMQIVRPSEDNVNNNDNNSNNV